MKSIKNILTKTFAGITIVLLQNCTINHVENDFLYESLTDTIDEPFLRNRKYDYARVKVNKVPLLKIPVGLSGKSIKPKYELPYENNNFSESQVSEVKKKMLPPNYNDKFDMNKIINEQISKIAICMLYDDKRTPKLVFREPVNITIELLSNYFKNHADHYKIKTEKDEMLSNHIITVKDIQKNIFYVFRIRRIDKLSSLVTIVVTLKTDKEILIDNYINASVGVLSEIRKNLNGKSISIKDQRLVIPITQKNVINQQASKEKSNLRRLVASQNSFSFGLYDKIVHKSNQKQKATVDDDIHGLVVVPVSDSQVYTGAIKAPVLNT